MTEVKTYQRNETERTNDLAQANRGRWMNAWMGEEFKKKKCRSRKGKKTPETKSVTTTSDRSARPIRSAIAARDNDGREETHREMKKLNSIPLVPPSFLSPAFAAIIFRSLLDLPLPFDHEHYCTVLPFRPERFARWSRCHSLSSRRELK